ncbi:MAG: aconitate hydratase [Planctomycetes bacterium]|nr:aconitate hydratase [Planctomycetota bacterium]
MAQTLAQKILAAHLVEGTMTPGSEIGLRIDQTITQDATGTTAFLLFEAMDIPRVRTEVSVSYVDHNMAQFGPENHNDHLYLASIAAKVGAYHSRPGNGICHQVHLERFARPGATQLGSDSHTPTAGGIGAIAIGAGGLDVAVAMGGGTFYTPCPRIIGVELKGRLSPWVASKDIILRLLSILTTKGNVGCLVEYFGDGVATLNVPARSTCTNMGAELGVTTSVFPSDDVTRQFMVAQGRQDQWTALAADAGAAYDRIAKRLHPKTDAAVIENIRRYCTDVKVSAPDASGKVEVSFGRIVIDLGELEPLAAAPGSPDHVVTVASLAGTKVDQVLLGSCTNSSYQDLVTCAAVMKGRTVHPDVELGIHPGSRQVLAMLQRGGALGDLVACGARILESACGACIGQGFSPGDGRVSLRTFNRNFTGRSGTPDDQVYLVSPQTAIAAAVTGRITDPRTLSETLGIPCPTVAAPEAFVIDDRMINPPADDPAAVQVVRGSTIVKPPSGEPVPASIAGPVQIKVGDKITTDHIMPAGTFLKYRSNVPVYARYVFDCFNTDGEPTFAQRCLAARERGAASIIVAGDSYGQGSSREHAALCPMYLGVRAVLAKSIERMHFANLVNFAVMPLVFADAADYDAIEAGDELRIDRAAEAVRSADTVEVVNATRGTAFTCRLNYSARQRAILAAGGLLNHTRQGAER